ncbi:Conserved_hypothetical protein [Hexamita inflata]|uniref:Uncharacterized protein n=1 Tax=Hexamita inflata TaxID=28002 RepID=A0AA86RQQ8_9EUKA|nr:Conserved hypothetical protein [Hexamita inflata]
MQHFQSEVINLQSSYDILLREDKFYLIKDTYLAGFGRCPSLYVVESNTQTINLVYERFQHIIGVVELVVDYIKEKAKTHNIIQMANTLITSKAVKLIENIDSNSNYLEQLHIDFGLDDFLEFKNSVFLYKQSIQNIPDKVYQFMICLDLSQFKSQYTSYLMQTYKQVSDYVIGKIFTYTNYLLSMQIIDLFTQQVSPSCIKETENIIQKIKSTNYVQKFAYYFDLGSTFGNMIVQSFFEKYQLTEEQVSTLVQLQYSFIYLIKISQRQEQLITIQKQLYLLLVTNVQQWLKIQSDKILENLKEIQLLKLDDINESQTYPVHFRTTFTTISKNYKLDAIDCQQNDVNKLCSQFRKEEQSFYASFARITQLQIFTKRLSHDKLVLKVVQNDNVNEYQPTLYERSVAQSSPIFIQKIIGEQMYLVQELSKINEHLSQWEANMDIPKAKEIIKFEEVKAALTNLYNITCGSFYVDQIINSKMELAKVNSNQLSSTLNDIANSISYLKDNSQLAIPLHGQDGHLIYEFNFTNWKDFIEIVEKTIFKQIGAVHLIQECKANTIQQNEAQQIEACCGINLMAKQFTIDKLINKLEESPIILDQIIEIREIADKNQRAIQILQRIEESFSQIVVGQHIITEQSIYPQIIIQCDKQQFNNLENVITDSYYISLQILNNIDFLDCENISEHKSKSLKYKNNQQNKIYSQQVEQLAKDIEATSLNLKFLLNISKSVPLLLEDLKQISEQYVVANKIKKENAFQTEHPYLDFNIRFISQNDINTINQQFIHWSELLNKFIRKGQKLALLCSNQQLMKQLLNIFNVLSEIHLKYQNCRDVYIFQQFKVQEQFNIPIDEIKTSSCFQKIIPMINQQLYPHGLLLPTVIQQQFGKFPQQTTFLHYNKSLQQQLLQNVTDIVIGQSPTKGRVILGLRSQHEFLEFKTSVIAPERNFMVLDTIIDHINNAITEKLCDQIDSFNQIVNELINNSTQINNGENEQVYDVILLGRLTNFIKANMFVINAVLLQTTCKQLMVNISRSLTITKENELQQIQIFQSVYNFLQCYIKALEQLQTIEIKPLLLQMCQNYIDQFQVLDKEIHFKLDQYFRVKRQHEQRDQIQIENKDVQEEINQEDDSELSENHVVQELSIVALLGATEVCFPMLEFSKESKQIYITTNNGTCRVKVGEWWGGIPSKIPKLNVQQYSIVAQMIEGYNQKMPILLLSSEHKGLNSIDTAILINVFSLYTFKRVVYIQVSEIQFAQNLLNIAIYLNCGFIVVICGAEYLKGSQQFELVQLSLHMRTQEGDYLGLLTPYIDKDIIQSNQQKGENKIPLSFRNSKTSDFKNQGVLMFLLPQLSSIVSVEKFVHVPQMQNIPAELQSEIDIKSRNTTSTARREVSQSFILESSRDSTSDNSQSDISINDQNRKTGSNNYIQLNSINMIGQKFVKTFNFKVLVNVEFKTPSFIFEQVSQIYGKAFYEIACFLKSLSPQAPKLLVSDMDQLISKTDSNKVINVATVTLNFLLRTNPDVFNVNIDSLEMPTTIANFVASAFGCDRNESNTLQKMAKDCYQYQINILSSLNLPIPASMTKNNIDYVQYFAKYLTTSCDQLISTIRMFQNIYQIHQLTISDILLVREFQKVHKPFLLISPQMNYLRAFINVYSGIFKQKVYWVASVEEFDDVLIQIQLNPSQQAIQICYFINDPINFDKVRQIIIAFNSTFIRYQTLSGVPIYFTENDVPQITLITDHIVSSALKDNTTLSIIGHQLIIFPQIESSSAASIIMTNKLKVDKEAIYNFIIKQKANHFKFEKQSELQIIHNNYKYKFTRQSLNCIFEIKCQWKLKLLRYITDTVISMTYQNISSQFKLQNTADEASILSTMIFYQLQKLGMLKIHQKQIYNQSALNDSIDSQLLPFNSHDQLSKEKQLLNENLAGSDMRGMFSEYTDDTITKQVDNLQLTNQFKQQYHNYSLASEISGYAPDEYIRRENIIKSRKPTPQKISFEEVIDQTVKEVTANGMISFGCGAQGSIQYDFDNFWLSENIFQPNFVNGIQNLISYIFAAVWNTLSLYQTVVGYSGKWDAFDIN